MYHIRYAVCSACYLRAMHRDWTGQTGIDRWKGCVIENSFFQVFPCLITYCEKTFLSHFLPSSQKVKVFPKYPSQYLSAVSVTWLRCGFTTRIQEEWMQDVQSRHLISPEEEHQGYGKQVWLLFTSLSYLFHSLSCQVYTVFVCSDTPLTTQVGDY